MAIADEWDQVHQALNRLDTHPSLAPTLVAMRKLVALIQHDPTFADVRPRVSLASIVFFRGTAKHSVCVGWKEDVGYDVSFLDAMMEFSDSNVVREDAVVQALRGYLNRLATL